jgi:hypothetical protein
MGTKPWGVSFACFWWWKRGATYNETAQRPENGNTPLAEVMVNVVVEQRGEEVAHKGGQEEERHGGVGYVIVDFNLGRLDIFRG